MEENKCTSMSETGSVELKDHRVVRGLNMNLTGKKDLFVIITIVISIVPNFFK